jgi:hypothetical protein
MQRIDQELDVVIARQVGIAPQLGRADARGLAVVGAYADVQRVLVPQHFDDGVLRRRCAHERLTLAEVGDGIRARPIRLGELPIEMDGGRCE